MSIPEQKHHDGPQSSAEFFSNKLCLPLFGTRITHCSMTVALWKPMFSFGFPLVFLSKPSKGYGSGFEVYGQGLRFEV
jgi:hypothetical protein